MYLPAEIILKAIDKTSGTLKRIGFNFRLMSKDTRKSLETVGGLAKRVGLAIWAAAAGITIAAGKASAAQETLLGKLAGEGVKDLEAVRKKAEEISDEVAGIDADSFLATMRIIVKGLPQLSDKVKGIVGGITAKAATAVGEKDLLGPMNTSFVKFHKNWKDKFRELSEEDFAKYFGGLVSGGTEFGLTGEGVLKVLDDVNAEAAAAGVSLGTLGGVVFTLASQLKNPREAGSKFKSLLDNLAKAGKELGLPFLNAKKQLKDLPSVLALIEQKYGKTLDETEMEDLRAALGAEGATVIRILFEQRAALAKNIGKAYGAFSLAGYNRMLAKLKVQNEGMGESSSRVWQSLKTLAAGVGGILNPVLLPLIDRTQKIIIHLREWARRHPELTKAVILGAFVFGGLTAAIGAATLAMLAFNAAVWANPATWIFVGIVASVAAVAASIFYLWDNWQEAWTNIKNYTVEIVGALLGALGLIVAWNPATWGIAAIIAGVMALSIAAIWLYENWNKVLSWLTGAWASVRAGFMDFADFLKDAWNALVPDSVTEAGKRVILTFWEGLKAGWGLVKDWFNNAIDGLLKLIPAPVKRMFGINVATGRPPAFAGPRDTSLWPNDQLTPAAQALGRGNQPAPASRVDGRIVVDFRNAPKGTRITELRETGDTGIDLSVGLNTVGMMP